MKRQTLVPALVIAMATINATRAETLEDWQFNEDAATQFSGLTNTAGSATWPGDVSNAATDGSGNLILSVSVDDSETTGEDESTKSIFRNTGLTVQGQTTGKYEMAFTYASATLDGGDATGANVGFTVRNSADVDLVNVRLQRQNSVLRLQRRDGSSNTDLENFNATSLAGPLAVRVVFDLDDDTYAVYWTPSGQSERCSTNIPMATPSLTLDAIRLYASTNTTDWGPNDSVAIDFLTLSTYTDPPIAPAIEDWQFNIDQQSLGTAQNDAGVGTLGGNADNAQTSVGSMVFTQGASSTDNIFRNGDISTPGQTTGRFSMEWLVSSATLAGGDETGANTSFGMRDAEEGKELFGVRIQRQNSSIRLQTRVGTTNTNLFDFGTDSITDLNIRVVADLDADTFDVHWQLGDGIGSCVSGIAMAEAGLEFDQVRTQANTNSTDWGLTDQVSVDYLVIRNLDVPTDLELSITQGPNAGEITLSWPTSSLGSAVLEESSDLGVADDWEAVSGTPAVNGTNNELTLTIGGGSNFYRLRTP